MAVADPTYVQNTHRCGARAASNNIWTLKNAVALLPPLHLDDPITRIGNRLLDNTTRVTINIPAAPPRCSKVFEQWAKAWILDLMDECHSKMAIGTDGSYKTKGKGISAFVVQKANQTLASEA